MTSKKKLEMTIKGQYGRHQKTSVTHFLEDLDPFILEEQLSRIPMIDATSSDSLPHRLCYGHCLQIEKVKTTKVRFFDIQQ